MKKTLSLITGVAIMSLGVAYLAIAWTEPASAPPESNIPAPLNTSINAQSKEGALVIGTNSGLTTGLVVQYGNVGIGTTDPGAKLEVEGNIIADVPTTDTHVATKGYVDAQASGGGGGGVLTMWGSAYAYPSTWVPAGEGTPQCPDGWTEAYAGWAWIPANGMNGVLVEGEMHCNATSNGMQSQIAAGSYVPFYNNSNGSYNRAFYAGHAAPHGGAITCRVCVN